MGMFSNPFSGFRMPWDGRSSGSASFSTAEPMSSPRQSPWMAPAVVSPIVGSIIQGLFGYHQYRKNKKEQRRRDAQQRAQEIEFAKMGLTWRMEDAKRAGIHPLAALGFSGPQPSPVSVGGYDDSYGSFGRDLGQNVSRALAAGQTKEQRMISALEMQRAMMENERIGLENQLLKKKILETANPGTAPMPVKDIPLYRTSRESNRPWEEAGSISDVGWADTSTGGMAPIPSGDVKQRIEDNIFQEFMHFYRNNLIPTFTGGYMGSPPAEDKFKAKYPGAVGTRWSTLKQEWVPVYKKPYLKFRRRQWR